MKPHRLGLSRFAAVLHGASLSPVAVLVLAVMCLGTAAASDPPAGGQPAFGSVTSGPPAVSTLAGYLEAFSRSYELPAAEHDSVALANAALQRAESWWWPRLSLREELRAGAGGPILDLSVSSRTALYDARSAPELGLAQADLALRTTMAEQARIGATAAFLQDVVAYAVLAPARDLALSAVAALSRDQVSPDPIALPPSQRSMFEGYLSERDGARWLEGAARDVQERLAHALSLPVSAVAAPTLEDVAAFVGKSVARVRGLRYTGMGGPNGHQTGVVTSAQIDALVSRCLEEAPALQVARARHALTLSNEIASTAPNFSLELVASADHSLALNAAAPGSPPTASIGLEARFVLPESSPVAGSLGAGVDLGGASQSAQLSWPPAVRADLHEPHAEDVLADETLAARWDARALWRAYEQATAERERRERSLAWALLDAHPGLSPMEVKALAAEPLSARWQATEAGADGSLTRPRVEAALAHLGQLAAAVELAAFCRTLPSTPQG